MLDFSLASPAEVCVELGERLKSARQAKGMQQAELALRCGISRNTLLALESRGQGSMATFVRVALVLGLVDQLQALFVMPIQSIEQLQALTEPARKRIRKPSNTATP